MDPRRKKIYIVLIVVCLVLSAGILGWSFFSDPSAGPIPDGGTAANSIAPLDASGSVTEGFSAPAVFPATKEFHTAVLESPGYTKLNPYKALDVTGQLGRPDPFRSY